MRLVSSLKSDLPNRGRRQGFFQYGSSLTLVAAVTLLFVALGNVTVPVWAAGSLIENCSFEEPLGSDGTIPGWTPFANGAWMSLVREHATDGQWALKISDQSPSQSVGMRSKPVPVTPGARYGVITDVFVESGWAMLYLEFWNAQGKRIESAVKATSTSVTGQVVQLIVENTAPAEAVTVTVLVYCSMPNQGVAYFDNIYLEKQD